MARVTRASQPMPIVWHGAPRKPTPQDVPVLFAAVGLSFADLLEQAIKETAPAGTETIYGAHANYPTTSYTTMRGDVK